MGLELESSRGLVGGEPEIIDGYNERTHQLQNHFLTIWRSIFLAVIFLHAGLFFADGTAGVR